jgi:hypothetical protein
MAFAIAARGPSAISFRRDGDSLPFVFCQDCCACLSLATFDIGQVEAGAVSSGRMRGSNAGLTRYDECGGLRVRR